jgi:hypothetical protein
MSRSGSGKPDPDLKGVELLFYQKGGSASFGAKIALSLNGVDPGCKNPIVGSTYRAKCSNILHDTSVVNSIYSEQQVFSCVKSLQELQKNLLYRTQNYPFFLFSFFKDFLLSLISA